MLQKSYTPALTNFTLALFEDLGWYSPDYSLADPMTFGAGKGCKFLEDHECLELIRQFPDTFCGPRERSEEKYAVCNTNRQSERMCNVKKHSRDLPARLQWFGSTSLGGSVYSDYCPISGPGIHSCSSTSPGDAQNEYERTSRCIERSNLVDIRCPQSTVSPDSLCEDVVCHPTAFYIPHLDVNCTRRGQLILTQINPDCILSVKCPSCESMCSNCSLFDVNVSAQQMVDSANENNFPFCYFLPLLISVYVSFSASCFQWNTIIPYLLFRLLTKTRIPK